MHPAVLVICGPCVKSILTQAKAHAAIARHLKRGEKLQPGGVLLCAECCRRTAEVLPLWQAAAAQLATWARAAAPAPVRRARR